MLVTVALVTLNKRMLEVFVIPTRAIYLQTKAERTDIMLRNSPFAEIDALAVLPFGALLAAHHKPNVLGDIAGALNFLFPGTGHLACRM
jgi:hypothetical protein